MNLIPFNKKDILLVEDNEMNTLLASAIINGTGARVTEANNGIEAIQLLRSRRFDLVLMDLHLPVMNGFDTAQYIRRELTLTVPIIAITANIINGEECSCKEVGMNGFLSKPYTETELLNAISRYLLPQGYRAQDPVPVHSKPAPSLYNLSFLENVCKGNGDLLKKMLQVFVEQTPVAVNEIKHAYDNQDFSTMHAVAHRIKPDIDNLNIDSLKEDIRKIEGFAAERKNSSAVQNLIQHLDQTISLVVRDLQVTMLP